VPSAQHGRAAIGVSPIELAGPPSYCEEHTATGVRYEDSVMSAVAQLPRRAGLCLRRPGRSRPRPGRVVLRSTWVLAAAGVVILVVSMVLMAHSAPGQPRSGPSAIPQRPARTGPAPRP